MTREAFVRELRTRSGTITDLPAVPTVPFVDRVVIPGGKIARASDYVALLHDLAALTPAEALAPFPPRRRRLPRGRASVDLRDRRGPERRRDHRGRPWRRGTPAGQCQGGTTPGEGEEEE